VIRVTGAAFRAHHPGWAWSPTSGEGSRLYGGRFNPKGVLALYLSLSIDTAIREASQGFGFRIPPLTIVEYFVECSEIADLTTPDGQKEHGVKADELECPWQLLASRGEPVPSWLLAERLIAKGIAGIVVPSLAPNVSLGSANLVLWAWGDGSTCTVTVFDPDRRLPRDRSSWT
jgi:RES domain-containing protein